MKRSFGHVSGSIDAWKKVKIPSPEDNANDKTSPVELPVASNSSDVGIAASVEGNQKDNRANQVLAIESQLSMLIKKLEMTKKDKQSFIDLAIYDDEDDDEDEEEEEEEEEETDEEEEYWRYKRGKHECQCWECDEWCDSRSDLFHHKYHCCSLCKECDEKLDTPVELENHHLEVHVDVNNDDDNDYEFDNYDDDC